MPWILEAWPGGYIKESPAGSRGLLEASGAQEPLTPTFCEDWFNLSDAEAQILWTAGEIHSPVIWVFPGKIYF